MMVRLAMLPVIVLRFRHGTESCCTVRQEGHEGSFHTYEYGCCKTLGRVLTKLFAKGFSKVVVCNALRITMDRQLQWTDIEGC